MGYYSTLDYLDEEETKAFERLTEEVVLIDGKHYRAMADEECADFIWGE